MAVQADVAEPEQVARLFAKSALHGTITPHEYVHYAAAKAGVDAFTAGLAKEVAGDGNRVNALAPGIADTEINAAAGDPNRAARTVTRIPMGRVAQPSEIATAIAWLLDPEASYVSGAVVRVAGGV